MLITGPTSLPLPVPDAIRVRTAAEMREAVLSNLVDADVLVMAAAVANYTAAHVSREKIAHKDDDLVLTLVPTRDILVDAAAWRRDRGFERPLIVGFAAETNDVIERARAKRQRKGIDLIVANDVSRTDAGFEADTNAVTLIGPDRRRVRPARVEVRDLGCHPRSHHPTPRTGRRQGSCTLTSGPLIGGRHVGRSRQSSPLLRRAWCGWNQS